MEIAGLSGSGREGGDAVARRCEFIGKVDAARRLEAQMEVHGSRLHIAFGFKLRQRVVDEPDVFDILRLRQPDTCKAGHAHGCQIVGQQAGGDGIDADEHRARRAVICCLVGDKLSGVCLSAVGDGVFEIEDHRVGVATGGLGELACIGAGAEQERAEFALRPMVLRDAGHRQTSRTLLAAVLRKAKTDQLISRLSRSTPA